MVIQKIIKSTTKITVAISRTYSNNAYALNALSKQYVEGTICKPRGVSSEGIIITVIYHYSCYSI